MVDSVTPVSSPPITPPIPRRAFLIGDDTIVRLERISLSIEREKFLAIARQAHIDAALQFIGVERMRRLAKLEHDEVRDIDDIVDRANPDTLDLRAQPLRTRSDLTLSILRAEKNGHSRVEVIFTPVFLTGIFDSRAVDLSFFPVSAAISRARPK